VTDGIGTALADGKTAVAQYFADLWKSPRPITELASYTASVNFDRRGEDDDRTAVVVWFPPSMESGHETGLKPEIRPGSQ
jgi:hypothetical protein